MKWAIDSPVKSTVYYTLIDSGFDIEHFRVLNGKYNHKANSKSSGIYAQTRRNVHRIEKGISASFLKKRNVFAKEYIEETINGVEKLLDSKYIDTPFHKWSFDVLNSYFSLITLDDYFNNLKNKWDEIVKKHPLKNGENIVNYSPFQHNKLPVSNISFTELDTLFKRRHSVRWYNDDEVDVQLIKKAVGSALASPSACNRQPFEVLYITGKKLEELKPLKLGFEMFSDSIKAFIFIVGDLSSYIEERDKHLIYIDGSLFAMSLMLALEALGISSCPINYPDVTNIDNKVQDILNLEGYQKGVMLMSVGYASDNSPIPFSAKKGVNEIFKEIN
ncbi:nitroreductase family protein [uncultured Formosa sp.]|uniref:nitroreductase family protein n=1 Tax=uncultured Formosa sp. TaxID=255435 RepID=UPI002631EEF9|nr:nitroreductase family protein [uncultured Formosa sp.]